ncbi:uncharacterized protein LOC106761261 [Vigna radiata var. radiata]|uniref:Uncharacterized protein LOC106761261 n=1 Tax=Vigna radiata var. radiata TaxID=3916 RepID=A0A1S3U2N3_VIGRR|nr:uncharacterized protein LOC106761261 [Vigna radiata var. radiata]
MENWEESHESLRADVSQLKDQIGQILAALESLKTTGESSSAQIEGSAHFIPPMFNVVGQSVPFPLYGFPPGYTPPIREYSGAEQAAFLFPTTVNVPPIGTQGPVLVSTPMASIAMNDTTTVEGTRVTVLPHVVTGNDPSAKATPNTALHGVISNVDEATGRLESLEARLMAVEGVESYGFGDVARLSLVPGVKIPHKFKAPEFEKYNGSSCPKSHPTMYCKKMAAYAYDSQLLIHVFQDSLAGVALNWYTHLEPSRIRCWADLADAFVKQYVYNTHVAPDRLQLQNMTKKDNETFKEYAQRWRELAAQVEPPLYDMEMVAMFVNTLHPPFYERMVGNVSVNFVDIIIIGERIEVGLKNGKIAHGLSAAANYEKSNFNPGKKKEGDVYAASEMPMGRGQAPTPGHQPYLSQPSYAANASFAHQTRPRQQQGYYPPHRIPTEAWKAGANASPNLNVGQNNLPRRNQFVNFTPIPMTYAELLPNLIEKVLVDICSMKPVQPPYPRSYDANAKCSYHGEGVGHSIEKFVSFKYKVQDLIDSGWLKFQEDKPNTEANPLSGHGSASMNVVEIEEHELVRDVSKIRSSKRFIFEALLKVGFLKDDYDMGLACTLHPTAGHSIEECVEFEEFLQGLLDKNLMQVRYDDEKELIEERKECSLARVEGQEPKAGKIHVSNVKKSFHNAGWINTDQAAAVEDEDGPEGSSFVWACSPDAQLNN